MNEKKVQKQTFLQGTAVLAMATILVKLMGFLFKTPLNNIIGSTGFGYFNTAYDVYNVLLMISTTGLPVAMSRMISEAQALGNEAQIKRIFKTAIYVFIALGIAGSLVMLVFCRQLSVMVTNSENSWAAIAALAPCVLLICLISAYRGFFQGQSSMTPTSVSQIFESITRLVVGLGLAWLVMELTGERFVHENGIVLEPGQSVTDYGDITLAAGGAILGVTLGCLISVIYLHVKYRGAGSALADAAGTPKSGRATMKELLSIAVPITLGSAGLQIINLFDTMIYMRRLELGLGWSVEMAENLKGVYNYQQTIFALPCAAGLFAMAEPVIRLLCTSYTPEQLAVATKMLMILGVAVIFNSLVLLFNAFMQAHGDVTSPVINMFIGGIVKIAVNYVLVGIPEINIVGAPVGTLVCYVVITVLNYFALRRCVKGNLPIFRNLIRPLIASAIMGAGTFMVYRVLRTLLPSGRLACLAALLFAVCLYLILAVALRCITYEDCMLLPKGEKIAKILRIREKN